MQRALRLAQRGAGWVAPNPLVGAVIVRDGTIIGQGYHKRFGQAHAEINALEDCRRRGNDPAQAVLFVNLEPCCHHGKTPPCTEAIAKAKIKRVEIATLDPFAEVSGQGARQLTQQGIDVKLGCGEKQALQLNAGYFKFQKLRQPLVILKWAQSIDGKLAWPNKPTHDQKDLPSTQRWISNEKSRHEVHQLRAACGAVLVGIGTVIADDPLLTARLTRKSPQPLRLVLDSQLRIPIKSRLITSARQSPVLVCTSKQTAANQPNKIQELTALGGEVLPVTHRQGKINLNEVLTELGQRGVTDLLVEGGPTVLGSFLPQGLADRLIIYIGSMIIGGNDHTASQWSDIGDRYYRIDEMRTRRLNDNLVIEADLT